MIHGAGVQGARPIRNLRSHEAHAHVLRLRGLALLPRHPQVADVASALPCAGTGTDIIDLRLAGQRRRIAKAEYMILPTATTPAPIAEAPGPGGRHDHC